MAEGVCRVFDEEDPSVPVVVKMRGHFEEEGWSMLADRKIPFVRRGTTDDAVKLLLRLISRRQ
jgi:succinyl-CoA synthetase beta subunit